MNNNNNIENKVVYLRLDDILPNRFQPRENFDEADLEELANSIKEHGVIQPIIVRQVGDKYELIAGERRTKASALAGLTTIPAIIRNMDDKESAKISLLENLQRKNLSAIEEARTYKRIKELDNMTQEELAKTLGKSQPAIANKLRLLSLPEEVQDALIKNQISERHARSLLNIKDKATQLNLLDRIRNERLTVRELDNEIKKINEINNNQNNTSSANDNSYNSFEDQVTKEEPNSLTTNNNFFENSINNNYHGNFNNMGLNDYQSGINNNMFNNIPTNFQNNNNSFNNMPVSGFMNQNNDVDYSEFNTNSESYLQNDLNQPNNNPSSFSSLGSMFDNSANPNLVNNSSPEDNSSNTNLFISHIQEDEVKKQGNQFLPNFDSLTADNNNNYMQQNFSNNNEAFGLQNSANSFDQGNFNNFQNPSYPNDLNSSFNNYQAPIDEFDNFNNYPANQGSLFNQPLNIVDVPRSNSTSETNVDNNQTPGYDNAYLNSEEDSYEENNNSLQGDMGNENNDHLPYENILFAKPVPIQPEPEGSSANSEDVEVIDEEQNSQEPEENKDKSKNEYINIDHVRTIFTTRDAVLELKKTTDRIKQDGINIDTEEIDFDDVYQITIKIKKEEK